MPAAPADLEIRSAQVEDVPLIHALIAGLAEYEKLSHEFVASPEDLQRTLFGDRPGAEVLLAFTGGACQGFALFFPNYSTFLGRPGLYLEDLFVQPEARGQGIGTALLTRLARIACDRDYGRVEWSVLDWNAPSIGFYKSLGAVPMEEWTTFRLAGDAIGKVADR